MSFFGGFRKDLVSREKPRTVHKIKAQITAMFDERLCHFVPARLQLYINQKGGCFCTLQIKQLNNFL